MLKAIKTADLGAIRKFLAVGNNIDKTETISLPREIINSDLHDINVNATLLQCAVLYNKFNIVEFLINAGANINSQDAYKMTALFYAIQNDTDLKIIELLIEHGIDINQKNKFAETPLHIAVLQNILQIVELLLQKGADTKCIDDEYNLTPLHLAALNGNIKILETLVCNGANVNAKCGAGQSELHNIVYYSQKHQLAEAFNEIEHRTNVDNIVHFLTDHGADINCRDHQNITPLHMAVSLNDVITAKIFLKYGAIVNTLDSYNRSPLLSAIETQNVELMSLLLDNNANMKFEETYKSPLHYAAILGNMKMLNILLQRNPDIDKLLYHGKTPLIYAIEEIRIEIVRRLIDYGANVNLKTRNSEGFEFLPLVEAIKSCNAEIIHLLIQNGADVNCNANGYTPLHHIIKNPDDKTFELFLKYRPNVNIPCKAGTPLILAIIYGRTDFIPLLLEYGADVNVNFFKESSLLQYAINNCTGVIVDMLLLHIIHLKDSDKYVSQENWDTFNLQITFRGSSFEKELETLKSNFIHLNPRISLYDVYTKTKYLRQISMCCRNKEVRDCLKKDINKFYLETFEHYSATIMYKIATLIEEAKVFDESHELLRKIVQTSISLPVEITVYIIQFFSYKEKLTFLSQWKEPNYNNRLPIEHTPSTNRRKCWQLI